MRKTTILLFVSIAMTTSPVLAQGRSGGGGGNPGGMGNGGGMGSGPPMSVPGRSSDANSTARDISRQRGQFGRDFAEQQKMTRAEEAKLFRSRAAEYQAESSGRRTEAMALAAAAREGKPVNQSAKEIRSGLKRDLTEWRDTFRIDRKSWQDIRDKTLADEGDLTPAQWAERRAEWFDARDQWIEKQKDWASKSSDTEQ